MHHELKSWDAYFQPVWDGDKLFEIRLNHDRGFNRGDTITLNEWEGGYDPKATGRWVQARILYVCTYKQKKKYVVFGFRIMDCGGAS